MLSTLTYISLGTFVLYIASHVLNIVFTLRHKQIPRFITGICQATFLTATLILIMTEQLPESRNLFKISLTGTVLTYTGFALAQFHSGKIRQIVGTTMIFAGTLAWYELLLPSFKLYEISPLALVLSIAAYLLLGALYIFLISKKFKSRHQLKDISLILTVIAAGMACLCNYASIITIIYSHSWYTLCFLLGMTLLVLSLLVETAHKLRKTSVKYIFLHELFLNLSLLFNCGAVCLMTYL